MFSLNIKYYFILFNLITLHFFFCNFAYGKEYTLDEILRIAVEKNLDLNILKTRVESNRGKVISAGALLNPEIDFKFGIGRELMDSALEYSFGIAQTIEFPSKRLFRKKFAQSLLESSEKDLDYLLLELKSKVKKSFLKLLLDKKILSIMEGNLKAMEDIMRAVQIKVDAGELPEYEYIKVKTDYLTMKNQSRKAKRNVYASKIAINSILANSLEEDFDVVGELILRNEKYQLENLLLNMKERHPLVLRAKKELDLKRYALHKEKLSFLPDITLRLFYDSEVNRKSYGIGFSLSIPIFYRNAGEIISATMELYAAESEYHKVLIELSRSIKEEYQNYLTLYEQAKTFQEEILTNAKRSLEMSQFSYLQGESSLLDYLDSLRVYRSVLIEFYHTLFELEVSISELEKLTGEIK